MTANPTPPLFFSIDSIARTQISISFSVDISTWQRDTQSDTLFHFSIFGSKLFNIKGLLGYIHFHFSFDVYCERISEPGAGDVVGIVQRQGC